MSEPLMFVTWSVSAADPLIEPSSLDINSGMACREKAPARFFEENGADYWLQLGTTRVKIIGRGTWGALPVVKVGRSWKSYDPEKPICSWIQRMTVHHTHGVYTIQSLQEFHQSQEEGKADVAYHFFIDALGTIYEARPLGFMGSHSEADNSFNLGIALNGDFEAKPPAPAQLKALKDLLEALQCPCFSQDGIWTHRQRKQLKFPNQPEHWTSCPGDQLQQQVEIFAENQGLVPADLKTTKMSP